nr:MAG TPA: hypothetical protein [Caudoviricetes sp.]
MYKTNFKTIEHIRAKRGNSVQTCCNHPNVLLFSINII